MFKQTKGTAQINLEEPTFYVRYAGKTETFVASGKGCTHNAVQRIWDNSVDEKYMKRMSIFINDTGLLMKDLDNPKVEPVKLDIKDISYCCAEKGAHDQVFAWISKEKERKKLFCHAVLCHSRDKAQMMAIMLSQAFQVAYRDWKMKKERLARMKSKAKNTCKGVQTFDRPNKVTGTHAATSGVEQTTSEGVQTDAMPGVTGSYTGSTAFGEYGEMSVDNPMLMRSNSDVSSGSSSGATYEYIQPPGGQSAGPGVNNGGGSRDGHRHSYRETVGVETRLGSGDDDTPSFAYSMMNAVEENEFSFNDSAITERGSPKRNINK